MGQGREAGNDDQGGWGVGEVLSGEERNLRGISEGNVKGILKGIIRGIVKSIIDTTRETVS